MRPDVSYVPEAKRFVISFRTFNGLFKDAGMTITVTVTTEIRIRNMMRTENNSKRRLFSLYVAGVNETDKSPTGISESHCL